MLYRNNQCREKIEPHPELPGMGETDESTNFLLVFQCQISGYKRDCQTHPNKNQIERRYVKAYDEKNVFESPVQPQNKAVIHCSFEQKFFIVYHCYIIRICIMVAKVIFLQQTSIDKISELSFLYSLSIDNLYLYWILHKVCCGYTFSFIFVMCLFKRTDLYLILFFVWNLQEKQYFCIRNFWKRILFCVVKWSMDFLSYFFVFREYFFYFVFHLAD